MSTLNQETKGSHPPKVENFRSTIPRSLSKLAEGPKKMTFIGKVTEPRTRKFKRFWELCQKLPSVRIRLLLESYIIGK